MTQNLTLQPIDLFLSRHRLAERTKNINGTLIPQTIDEAQLIHPGETFDFLDGTYHLTTYNHGKYTNQTALFSDLVLGAKTSPRVIRICDDLIDDIPTPDPIDYAHESLMRSKRMIRKYIRHYYTQDTRMVTLTYAEAVHDRTKVQRSISAMSKAWLKHHLEPLKSLIIPELHPGGHGFHLHAVFFEKDFDYDLFRTKIWKRGRIRASDPMRMRELDSPHKLWSYLCKYLDKDLKWCPPGAHRYYRTGGLMSSWKTRSGVCGDALQTWRINCAKLDLAGIPYHATYIEILPAKFIYIIEVATGLYPNMPYMDFLDPEPLGLSTDPEKDYSDLYKSKEENNQNDLPFG
jgi:hypothetical protein